jgi:phage terminase small subunit
MSGVKGRSGGARANAGGARRGAGRKPKEQPPITVLDGMDPLEFLTGVMQGKIPADALQVRAAIAAAQYVHTKKADGGKKEEKGDAAKRVASGERFAPTAPPKLVAVK